jgi:structural maintenance of chromosome 1
MRVNIDREHLATSAVALKKNLQMGKLRSLEINNFKSYSGQHVIGPFNDFTCVIGPNGAGKTILFCTVNEALLVGKSNLMDAISFVLGVKSSHLRSSQLKDLIHRQATCSSDSLNIKKSVKPENGGASVLAIYQKTDGVVIEFKRSITPAGVSEYYINNCTVAFAQYTMALEAENILVKARNFLVFQVRALFLAFCKIKL